jgi:hypothetical protein
MELSYQHYDINRYGFPTAARERKQHNAKIVNSWVLTIGEDDVE